MKKGSIEEWIEKTKVRQWLQALSPVLAPAVMFGLWLVFAKLDKRADALSKFIAMTEPIPTIDLSLPKPIVLASLYHSTEDALKMIDAVIQAFGELPETIRKLFEDLKEDLMPDIDITPEISTPKEGESWSQWAERRLKEAGFDFTGLA